MPTYYCDLSLDYADATGLDHAGNEYRGVGGLQAAIRGTGNATALVAGDVLYVKAATGNLGRLVVIDCGVDVSGGGLGWALTDEVRNKDGAGDDWTGVICQLDVGADNQVILVELDSAYTSAVVDDADGIENTTQAESADPLDSHSCPGIQIDTNSGDLVTGHIKIVGVDASWAMGIGTTYCATLDGQSVATNCILAVGAVPRWWLENLILTSAAGYDCTGGTNSLYWVFLRVVFENAGSAGMYGLKFPSALYAHCIFRNNTTAGGIYAPYSGAAAYCLVAGNGTHGLQYAQRSLFACVFSANGDDNISRAYSLSIVNCVMDGSVAGSGIQINANNEHLAVYGCRLTNNNQYGIEMADAVSDSIIEDYNVFYLNGVAERLNIVAGANSRTAASAAEAGYTDQPNDDFTLTPQAIMAGMDAAAIDLDWTMTTPARNQGHFTAGIPRRYWPQSGAVGLPGG